MKRGILCLWLFLTMMGAAFAEVCKDSVSMVSYEQECTDNRGTIALKNHAERVLCGANFRLTYLDMKDNPLDYKDFFVRVRIDPGMVKKVDIEGYETRRHYAYYKSTNYGQPEFKVKFEMLKAMYPRLKKKMDKNVEKVEESCAPETADETAPETAAETAPETAAETAPETAAETPDEEFRMCSSNSIVVWIEGWLLLSFFVISYFVVFVMAQHRQRNAVSWLIVSALITPWLAMMCLMVLGSKAPMVERG